MVLKVPLKADIEELKRRLKLVGVEIRDPIPKKLAILLVLRGTMTHFDPFKKLEEIQVELKKLEIAESATEQTLRELTKDGLVIWDFLVRGYRVTYIGNKIADGLARVIGYDLYK